MPEKFRKILQRDAVRISLIALLWLIFISGLHIWRNVEKGSDNFINMGYMPVITNLACPLIAQATVDDKIRFSALKYASFADMSESFKSNNIQVGFIIAPLPLVMRSQGTGVKIVYIGNRHESTLVAKKELGIPRSGFPALAGKTVAVPMRYSGHNLAMKMLMKKYNLPENSINLVEMQPPDMASSVESGNLDAYFVGEPFAAQTLRSGSSTLVNYVEEVWPGFICNVMIVSDKMIEEQPELVQRLVSMAARSNMWAEKNIDSAAKIASGYWGQDIELVKYAMSTPPGRIAFEMYIPKREELKQIFDYMVEFKLIDRKYEYVLDEVYDDHFARNVTFDNLTSDIKSIRPE